MTLPESLYSSSVKASTVWMAEEIEVKMLETKSRMDNGKSYYKNE